MNARPLLIIVAVILILLIGYVAYSQMNDGTESPTATTTGTGAPATPTPDQGTGAGTEAPRSVTVTYGPNGFSPAAVTVPVGTRVTFVNQGGGSMWVATAQHPTHTVYDGTSTSEHCANGAPSSASVFDQCGAGQSFSFTFAKAGTWGYHNHADASDRGTVTVTP